MVDGKALLNAGFLRCHYIQGYCGSCGAWRAVSAAKPRGAVCACPQCGRPARFGPLGTGYTRRLLPEFQILWAPIRFIVDADEAPEKADLDLLRGIQPNVPAVAAALNVSRYRAEVIIRRAFPGRRAHAR